MKIKILIIIYSLILSFYHSLILNAQSSVFSTGEWYKIATTKTGIHKIDANFLKKANIDISKINPQNIKIFGNGGKMLLQRNLIPHSSDFFQNAIEVIGENDGKFDTNDYILFYAESPNEIIYNADNQRFSHQINYYSDTTFYFLNFSDSKGLRIKNQEKVTATKTINTFDDYFFRETEQKNLVGSGREWFGEYFGLTTEQNFDTKIEGIVLNSPILITSSVIGASFTNTKFDLKLNNQAIGTQELDAIGAGKYDIKGIENLKSFTIKSDGNITQKLTYTFDKNSQTSSSAYLNYFGIQVKRKLQFYEEQTLVRSNESRANETTNFNISQANNQLKIWDISNAISPENIQFSLNNSEAIFSAKTKDILRSFILFSDKNLIEPNSIQKINNQDLKSAEVPDLLIITPKLWKNQAQRLADFRKKNNNLSVLVATTDEVYNEFSSGQPDPTAIRNFAKYLYQKDSKKFKYLLLFADATFDYKNHNQQPDLDPNLFIPTYESRESLHPIYSFSSDDYFGFFEENEGEWKENFSGDHTLEIGIGRLPVKNEKEAQIVVDKLIAYETSKKAFGRWRSKVSFVADDGDFNIHQKDADKLSESATSFNKDLIINKIYVDAFPLVPVPNGNISPQTNKKLNDAVNEGSLIINYNGHGGESGWTEEKILTISDIQRWRNPNNLSLFLTATCEFGRYDNPATVSGAELAMLSPNGAAIGLLTTTRPVFANTNYLLNDAFYKAFADKNLRLGDILKITKNNSLAGAINRNFALLGDPSMALAYPENKITLTKINGQNIDNQQIKALSKVIIEGEISNENGQKKTDFNGKIQVSVFDKPSTISTLGQKESRMKYEVFRNQIFEGLAEVKNGTFKISFVVPKDINYQVGKGKIHCYAVNADSTADAVGSNNEILIGGSETAIQTDNQAPKIELSVDKNNVLQANISDENGINISQASIGHEMVLTLNDTLQVVVNQYFTNIEDFTKGILKYAFGTLPEGKHTVKLKIWDSYNNSAEASLDFIVETEKIKILSVSNFPNPFENQTTFQISHNRENDDLSFKIEVFDAIGRKVFEQENTCYLCENTVELGMNIEPNLGLKGVFYYKISAFSLNKNLKTDKGGKLIIWK